MEETAPATPGDPLPKFAPRAYEDKAFLESDAARILRIMSEFIEPEARFEEYGIRNTIVMFGSARTLPPDEAQRRLDACKAKVGPESNNTADVEGHREALRKAENELRMSKYYAAAEELAYRLTQWSDALPRKEDRFLVCTGGGPGIMEAANRGAHRAGGRSIGLNIDLRHEQSPNPYITEDLKFQFRYFMMRKFWFTYPARCMVAFPGGFGTLDEVFEILTLMQAERIFRPRPIVFFGSEYWKKLIHFDTMIDRGTISADDLEYLRYCDDVTDAFEHITHDLERFYLENDKPTAPSQKIPPEDDPRAPQGG